MSWSAKLKLMVGFIMMRAAIKPPEIIIIAKTYKTAPPPVKLLVLLPLHIQQGIPQIMKRVIPAYQVSPSAASDAEVAYRYEKKSRAFSLVVPVRSHFNDHGIIGLA